MDNDYCNDICTEHRRKHTDICTVNLLTGKKQTMGEFAKRQAIIMETSFLPNNYTGKACYEDRLLVAKCTPESVHHERREDRLDKLCR